MEELNDNLFSEYINGKLITFNEFLHIYDKIKDNDYQFDVKYTLTPVEPYLETDYYVLEHNPSCNNYDYVKSILDKNKDAILFTTYNDYIRNYDCYNINTNTLPNYRINHTQYKEYTLFDHTFYIYPKKYVDQKYCILNQRRFRNCMITYPFKMNKIEYNTQYNLYNFKEYKMISNPKNQQGISKVFGIKMILIDIDGTKDKWYDKLITVNNVKFNS